MRIASFYTLFLIFWTVALPGQQVIFLTNPSFEDNPRYGHTPSGWRNCAFNNESPPDVHPVPDGDFQVTQMPVDGATYLGLVVRDTRTVEAVGQMLNRPLEAGRCYMFSLALCKSEKFFSQTRSGGRTADFSLPTIIRIWGGLSPCGQKQLLAESPLIEHTDWRLYTFRFLSPDSLSWFSIEANYDPNAEAPYNGNILIDHASPFIPIHCETLEPLIDPDTLTIPAYTFPKLKTFGLKRHYIQTEYGSYVPVSLRKVKSADDVEALLLLNCPEIGFVKGRWDFLFGPYTPLKEVAYNVSRFPDMRLVVGLHYVGRRVTKKRIRYLQIAFKEVRLKKDRYQIIVDESVGLSNEWHCNQEIWLRLERE